ncbi:MAG: proline iminopeptidase-family hydrolase [Chitinophagales bacterium]
MWKSAAIIFALSALSGCKPSPATSTKNPPIPVYETVQTGGVKMVPVMNGKYKVWTKKFGSGPIKVLLLHGGPGLTHEYFECFESFLPQSGIECYYYDQLGSGFSDIPSDTSYISLDRFVDEVEEVRRGLDLDQFYLLGHSWGGMLTMEYAVKYPQHLKGAIISNMTASIPNYVTYINKLRQQLPADDVKKMEDFEARNESNSPEYQRLVKVLYDKHICRLPVWPEALDRSFRHINATVYNTMQGNNEFVVTGKFKNWDAWSKLPQISCPTLVIGADYDEMDPQEIRKMGQLIPHARVLMCKGSHMCMWDDQQHYFGGLIRFLRMAEGGEINARSGDQALTYFD